MEIDEEPPSVANTCSRESRRQCVISLSMMALIASIAYTASTIIYTSYVMVAEMDKRLDNHVIKVIGMYDNCSTPPKRFNVASDSPDSLYILWNDPPLTYATLSAHLYVHGTTDWFLFPNMTIGLASAACHSVLFLLEP